MKKLFQNTQRTLSVCLFGITLIAGAVSMQALAIQPKGASVCGGGCTLRPHTICGGGCFCDTSLGDGVNQGVCQVI